VVGPAYRCRIGADTDVLDDSVLAGLYFRQEVDHGARFAADRQPCSVSSKAHLDDDVVGDDDVIRGGLVEGAVHVEHELEGLLGTHHKLGQGIVRINIRNTSAGKVVGVAHGVVLTFNKCDVVLCQCQAQYD